jgi:hypothetical protein
MRRTFGLTAGLALTVTVGLLAQQPAPAPAPAGPPSAQPGPWANKFFLPDIATNREQPAPPVVTHNFGDVPHGTLCVHKFTITNVYDVPMQITEVRKSCHCLDFVPMNRVLQPNESADFTVTMNSGKFVGVNAQTFYITFGPKFISTAVIRVQANSRTDVSVVPGAVAFGTVAQGVRGPTQSVMIKYGGKTRDWKLTEVIPPQAPLDVHVTEVSRGGPLRGGAEYRVDVTIKPDAPPGAIAEPITLKTNDPSNPLLQVTVTGTVVAPLELAPNRVRFDGVEVGQVVIQRVLIRAAKPFRIVSADISKKDGLSIHLPPPGAGALPVQVVTVRFEPERAGTVTREFRIKTDLDGGAAAVLTVEGEGIGKR